MLLVLLTRRVVWRVIALQLLLYLLLCAGAPLYIGSELRCHVKIKLSTTSANAVVLLSQTIKPVNYISRRPSTNSTLIKGLSAEYKKTYERQKRKSQVRGHKKMHLPLRSSTLSSLALSHHIFSIPFALTVLPCPVTRFRCIEGRTSMHDPNSSYPSRPLAGRRSIGSLFLSQQLKSA